MRTWLTADVRPSTVVVKVEVLVRSLLTGITVGLLVVLPWTFAVRANYAAGSTWPWAAPPTLLLLWIWLKWVNGAGWPQDTSADRRRLTRARPVSEDGWSQALTTGIAGTGVVLLFRAVLSRFFPLTTLSTAPSLPIPFVSAIVLHLTGSVVAGVVEEVSFRGFMQQPLEERFGGPIAILISASVFTAMHVPNQGWSVPLLGEDFGFGVVFGLMAYQTNSTLPSMSLHAGLDAIGGLLRFLMV